MHIVDLWNYTVLGEDDNQVYQAPADHICNSNFDPDIHLLKNLLINDDVKVDSLQSKFY